MGSSFFWLLLSIFAFVESLRLGVGTLHNPGMGFMSFGASGLLGMLSLILFFQSFLKKEEPNIAALFHSYLWKRVLLVLISLMIYAWLMPRAGFLISTLLLMILLFGMLERKRIWRVLILSCLTTLITYLVFSVWLKGQFPKGPFPG